VDTCRFAHASNSSSTRIASPKVAATFLSDPSPVSGATRFESDAGFARLSAPLLLEQVYHSL
jgi:hypothetical protein